MPSYTYQAVSNEGKPVSGTLTAASAQTASEVLRAKGFKVQSVRATDSSNSGSVLAKIKQLNAGKPTVKHVLDFTTQLAVMVRAGISLRVALEGIAEQTKHARFKAVLLGLKADVESGKQFSEALTRHPELFGPLYVNMVRASEMSGSFGSMLDRIAAYLTQQIETRKMVVGAMIYPGVIAFMAVGVTIFLLTFVLPAFGGVFEGKEEALPWSTKFLMGLSEWMVGNWPIVAGAAAAGLVGFVLTLKTEPGKVVLDKFKLGFPIVKSMFRALYISRSLQTMGELINAGVPMLDTIAITGDISGSRSYRSMWRDVHENIRQGRKIAGTLAGWPLLPHAVVQMIGAGEESGKLGEVLDEVSDYYAKQLKDAIKAVTGMIEPIMIVVMGAIVGFIAMSVILPIFKMSQIVS
ncbi:MAG: type II secretion system F family protein [Phycisphaerales bacterium]